ncbi:MAG TPA: alpha/beta hydrolase [Stellaceae bacterium]|nr:alpha/beta hydrolase [Stellaceae bacterium]
MGADFVRIGDVQLEVERRGTGRTVLLLPGEDVLEPDSEAAAALARSFDVVIPSPPGFGRSSRPDWIDSVDDVSYLYLSLLERLDLRDVCIIGCSLGGWIAAEMATKDQSRLAKLVLVAPYGVKFGGAAKRDIADMWTLSPRTVMELKWCDPATGQRDIATMSDEQLAIIARNLESFARFCWEPYMHNPKLRHRLERIAVPTLLVWGEKDGIVSSDYGRSYANLIPRAEFELIAGAAHYPHLEQPGHFMRRVGAFLR